jgi:recombination associated protein RdgC
MSTTDLSERSFLGRDFLTWLWFRCEVEGGEFELDGGPTAVLVEDALALVSVDEDGSVMTLRKGSPTARPEAASALAAGMALKKARLVVARGPREWQFALDGDTLDVSSLKTPSPEDAEAGPASEEGATPEDSAAPEAKKTRKASEDEALDELAEKLASADEARDVVEALYRQFLDVRLTKDWERVELPRMQSWVGTKLEKAAVEVGLQGG